MSAETEVLLGPTPRYYRVLGRADEIARATGNSDPGTEHLLLAIIHEGESVPAQVLARLIDLDLLEAGVLEVMNSPASAQPSAALNSAAVSGVRVAAGMGHAYIGVEHMFLDIVRNRDCAATRALARLVEPGEAEAAVIAAMNSPEYLGEPGAGASHRVYLPEGAELDGPLRQAMAQSTPEGATFGFNWDSDGRPWIHVTVPDNGRSQLSAALASLGRPPLD